MTKTKSTPSFIVSPYETLSVEALGETLKRQILELAIDSDNPQFKLDAYKATVERGKPQKTVELATEEDAMTRFRASIRNAEAEPNGAE
jgi:hypothetical protein